MNSGTNGWSAQVPLAVSNQQTQLASNVTLSATNTYQDILSLTLGAGQWLVMANLCVNRTAASSDFEAKLWNGTIVYASSEVTIWLANTPQEMQVFAIVTLSIATLVRVACASSNTTTVVQAANVSDAAGNTASTLTAVLIA